MDESFQLKKYLIIHDKLCHDTGRFKIVVFKKDISTYSSKDLEILENFRCDGFAYDYRQIIIDLKTKKVRILRPAVSEFPDGYRQVTYEDDKEEIVEIIDSDA